MGFVIDRKRFFSRQIRRSLNDAPALYVTPRQPHGEVVQARLFRAAQRESNRRQNHLQNQLCPAVDGPR